MAIWQDPVQPANIARIESNGTIRTISQPIGEAYSSSGVSGTLAALFAAGGTVWLMRMATGAGSRIARIDRLRLHFVCIGAFTVPLTVGRRLAVFRGVSSSPATSGGTAIDPNPPKALTYGASSFDSAGGGDVRISTTAALTVTGVTWETIPMKTMTLAHVGGAGNSFEVVFDFNEHPCILRAGEVLAVRAPIVFDAAGTWMLVVNAEWREETPMA